jgi:hypothetical protein
VAKPVVDAFLATPESLPSKIVVAKKAIATRLTNVPEPDEDERQALRDALRALRVLMAEACVQPPRQEVAEPHPKFS